MTGAMPIQSSESADSVRVNFGVGSVMSATTFGVTQSAKGQRWISRRADEQVVGDMARRMDVPEALARVLVTRGVTMDTAADFLNPTLRGFFPDPASFVDMDAAAAVILDAVEAGRKLCVFADYDVDGATSAALLLRYWRALGVDGELYVPDRIDEGYGPNTEAFKALKARGVEVVVTVDCGAMAHEPLQAAAAEGLTVVVVDHHQMTAAPPIAAAVINPNRPDCQSGCGYLAAAGVTYVLLAALNREGRRRGVFTASRPAPDLLQWLDLTALGSVCDVVPLIGLNRALVTQGLKVINATPNLGVNALSAVAGVDRTISATTLGFVHGPRINAGGRVGQADLGARLLSTDDTREAETIAAQLHSLNTERRSIESDVLKAAIAQVDTDPKALDRSVIVAAGEGWHPGVVGVVAGRLKERYARPAVVIGVGRGEGAVGKGSARSVAGVDLGAAIAAVRDDGLLIAGGGHAMAAGLTVAPGKIDALAEALDARIRAQGPAQAPELHVDAEISARGVGRPLADCVAQAGPFGPGNPEPIFAARDLRVKGVREVGTGHLRTTLEDEHGVRVHAIAFRAGDVGLADVLRADARAHVALRVKPGKGNYVDVEIEDAASAQSH